MGNRVILSKIQIKKLFNRFDYCIDFRNEENVSILTAPNGCGKTTIFNFINFIFNPSYESFNKIILVPFESFECFVENGPSIRIERTVGKKTVTSGTPFFAQKREFDIYNAFQNKIDLIFYVNDSVKTKLSDFLKSRKSLKRPNLFSGESEEERLTEDRFLFQRVYREIREICIEFLTSYREKVQYSISKIPITFISANRVSDISFSLPERAYISYRFSEAFDEYQEKMLKDDPLAIASKDIVETLRGCNNKYQARLSDAKDRLPNAFLHAKDSIPTKEGFNDFKEKWNGYQKKLRLFKEVGLIGASESSNLDIGSLEDAYFNNNKFLETYIAVFGSTVEPYEKIYEKIKLFSDILNSRNELTHKVVKFSQKGIHMEMDGEPLDLNCLSSGEKNDFVMFYNLIFKAKTKGVILVDEPEISLHIQWQEEYLDHLITICRLNNIQAIVATHSPNIISNHTDLILDFKDGE